MKSIKFTFNQEDNNRWEVDFFRDGKRINWFVVDSHEGHRELLLGMMHDWCILNHEMELVQEKYVGHPLVVV